MQATWGIEYPNAYLKGMCLPLSASTALTAATTAHTMREE